MTPTIHDTIIIFANIKHLTHFLLLKLRPKIPQRWLRFLRIELIFSIFKMADSALSCLVLPQLSFSFPYFASKSLP